MTPDADVIIVGAGPAGSAAAILLAARGHRVILADRARFPRDKPCGDYCNPGAVQALGRLGCLDDARAAGAADIAGIALYAQDGTGVDAAFPAGGGLLLPRRRLDAVLLACASRAGAEVVEGVAAETVQIHPDGVEVRCTSARRLRARVVLAADGMHSTIARALGRLTVPVPGRYTVGAYFSGLPQAAPRGELHLGPGYYCGVAHFGGGVANVCMALPRRLWRHAGPGETFAAALASLPVLADRMAGARRESAFRCAGPVGFASRRPAADRVLLIGDAAGQIEPMTGQGIFLALRSAELAAAVVADALATRDGAPHRLTRYAVCHRKEIAGRQTLSRYLQHLAFHPRLTPALIRRLAMRQTQAGELLGATGDVLPPGRVLSTRYLARLLL